MRPTISVVLLLLTTGIFQSCEVRFDWPWLEKNPSDRARPTGTVVTEDRTIGAFAAVRLEGMGRLVFDPEVPAGVLRITVDQGLLPAIRTEVDGGELRLREEGTQGLDPWNLEFRVAAPASLTAIRLEGLGSVESVSPLKGTSELEVALEGLGKIDLAVEAPRVLIRQNGSGELVLRGQAGTVEVEADGLGRVNVSGLITTNASVDSNGLGEILVYSSETLKVRANGLGAVRYQGNPTKTDLRSEGLTTISALD